MPYCPNHVYSCDIANENCDVEFIFLILKGQYSCPTISQQIHSQIIVYPYNKIFSPIYRKYFTCYSMGEPLKDDAK